MRVCACVRVCVCACVCACAYTLTHSRRQAHPRAHTHACTSHAHESKHRRPRACPSVQPSKGTRLPELPTHLTVGMATSSRRCVVYSCVRPATNSRSRASASSTCARPSLVAWETCAVDPARSCAVPPSPAEGKGCLLQGENARVQISAGNVDNAPVS